jgi:hypothetical protein
VLTQNSHHPGTTTPTETIHRRLWPREIQQRSRNKLESRPFWRCLDVLCHGAFCSTGGALLLSFFVRAAWPLGAIRHFWKATIADPQSGRHVEADFEARYRRHPRRCRISPGGSPQVTSNRAQRLAESPQAQHKVKPIAAYDPCNCYSLWHDSCGCTREPTISQRTRCTTYTSIGHVEPVQCWVTVKCMGASWFTQDREARPDGLA